MTSDRVDEGGTGPGGYGPIASWAGRRWSGLDRGWQASLLGLLAVCLVAVF